MFVYADDVTEEPAPDYDDDVEKATDGNGNSSEGEEDYVQLRKSVKNRISAMLNRDEWNQILQTPGETGAPAPPTCLHVYIKKYNKNNTITL